MKHPVIPHCLTFAAISALAILPALSAPITWGTAQNITGDSDVSIAGSLVHAFNIGLATGTETTVNGVTFTSTSREGIAGQISFSGTPAFNATTYGNTTEPFNSLSGNYKFILQSAVYKASSGGAPGAFTLTLEGLTIGAEYQIQVWTHDARNNTNSRTGGTEFSSEGGGTVSTRFNVGNGEGTDGYLGGTGQYVLGSFTATSTIQEIMLTSIITTGAAQINALQLRQLSNIPESGTSALLFGAAALMGAVIVRRRCR
ncbi:PEP-CTERM putative exosortase interaction domain-containing protein [Opitutaceae bacterium TAV1]|nr:PEP-CTERM putative exosortase interaction domain-containing protein [Opitutaceae bacterium TAV1]